MLKRMRNKKGFTLIELMIVVAIVGILAAIAIPAYLDYTVKAKLTEVSAAMDALGQAASEYHASVGKFPQSIVPYNDCTGFASVSNAYANWTYLATADRNTNCIFRAQLRSRLSPSVTGNNILMLIQWTQALGYSKIWDDTRSDIENKYLPKK